MRNKFAILIPGTVVTLLFNVYHTATFGRGTGICALAFTVSYLGGGIIDPFGHGQTNLYRVNPALVFAVPSGRFADVF